jgi:excinuclease ABC subunit C
MMKRAEGLAFILTSNEKEAFILEDSLVKTHMPRYNIILRDDKRYPCLRLNMKEPYPRLEIARRIKKDGALYFGPFSSAQAVRSTLKVIDRVFQLRKCKGRGLPKRTRPCLNYQMDRCLGACVHEVPEGKYRKIVQQVRLFLEGRNRELIERLQREMSRASERLDFEKAAGIRDQIRAIEKTVERQHVVSRRMEDQDVIALSQEGARHQVVILFVRKGALVGSRDYLMRDPNAAASEVMEAFLKQYYSREAFVPKQILVSEAVDDSEAITAWLSDLAGRRVTIHKPARGEKARLLNMALENARNLLEGYRQVQEQDLMKAARAVLKLRKTPRVIEAMDISNLHGQQAVGTVVSFVEGQPRRAGYRNYKIEEVAGIDDYGMMSEVVYRRVSKGGLPDLMIVDGGKGHLAAVKRVVDRHGGPEGPDVIALAKANAGRGEREDKIFLPNRKNPLVLGPDHPVLLLMMRIRDEAHRRAVTYHRKLRGRRMSRSLLDQIPGVGPKRKRELLRYFRSMDAIAAASAADLSRVPGISAALAARVHAFVRAAGAEEDREGNTG